MPSESPDITNKVQSLLHQSLKYLSFRFRSEQEIYLYLERKCADVKEDHHLIEVVVQKIKELNLIDDTRFSQHWAQARINKGKGPVIIQMELRQKGVSPEVIYQTLQALVFEDIVASACKQLAKNQSKWIKYTQNIQTNKAKQFLYSRGYQAKVIDAVIDETYSNRVK